MMYKMAIIAAVLLTSNQALAQKLGAGGTVVDGNQAIERCARPIGTVSLSEEKKTADIDVGLSPQMAALLAVARAQQD